MIENFSGTRRIGTIDTGRPKRAEVFVEVKWEAPRLSLTGYAQVPGARDADCFGQIEDTVASIPAEDLAFRMTAVRDRLVEVWRRWHLNDMRAGCEHQRAEGWSERRIDPDKPLDAYGLHFPGQRQASWNMLGWIRQDEHPDGLLRKPCEACGYRYGSAWLTEEVPEDVLTFLRDFVKGGLQDGPEGVR